MNEEMVAPAGVLNELLPWLAEQSARCDREDQFVEESLDALDEGGLFAMLVPAELGGGGLTYGEACETLRRIGKACPSAALCLAMHQHLVAAAVWRWKQDRSTEGLLRKVAADRLHLVSTGANDWLESSGTLAPVDGGYRLNAAKAFASGSPRGDLAVTSARLEHEGRVDVLHFAVPLSAPGVSVRDDWRAMGMRGTGSHTLQFDDVFVPDGSITLRRPAGLFHPVWSVVLTVALPLIMSVYEGVAERATEIARGLVRGDETTYVALGSMFTSLTGVRVAVGRMISICDELGFAPSVESASEVLACKTIAAREAVLCVDHAMSAVGGRAYYRGTGLERLSRDVRAAAFHPLQAMKQARFSGRVFLGLEPV